MNCKQTSFAPLLKAYNRHEDVRDVTADIDLYGIKYLVYDDSFRYYRAVDAMHSHSIWEIHLMQSGRQTYRVNEREVTLSDGEFVLVPPGIPHCQAFGEERFVKFSLLMRLPDHEALYNPPLGYYSGKVSPAMSGILNYLFETVSVLDPDALERLQMCMGIFFLALFEKLGISILKEPSEDEGHGKNFKLSDNATFCEQVNRYIRENISQILTVKEVADYFYISSRHLNRKIRAYYNKSFRELTNEIRCEYAKDLLAYSNLTVYEISVRLGFSSSANFNHFFSREEGQSPINFRNSFNEVNRVKL